MNRPATLVFIGSESHLRETAEQVLGSAFQLSWFPNIRSSFDFIFGSSPDLLVISHESMDDSSRSLLRDLKADPIFGRLPVLFVVSGKIAADSLMLLPVDDFLRQEQIESDLLLRIAVCLNRNRHVFEVNPLTRLPGNIAIMAQIRDRLDRRDRFSLAYCDLDHFKPYNDAYGFGRGDEVLKMAGRLVMNVVRQRQPHESFIGHIGGDDFVFMMAPDMIEAVAAEIVGNFDRIIPTFYDPEHRKAKAISSTDREGKERVFPFVSISIGITSTDFHDFDHAGAMSEVASEMKKFAKRTSGSCWKVDRRRSKS